MSPRIALALPLWVALAAPSHAGVDDPPPTIQGAKMRHAYSITGVVSNLNLATIIHCTSLHKTGMAIVAVQAYLDSGGPPINDVAIAEGVVSTVPPGGSAALAITEPGQNIAGFFEDATIDGAPISRGSARVLTNSPKLLCTAMAVDPTGSPPASMAPLHVFKKSTQKGD